MRKLAVSTIVALAAGCATSAGSFIDNAVGTAAGNMGQNAANRAVPLDAPRTSRGGSNYAALASNPAFLNVYMSVVFNYAFSSGGYDVTQVGYKPGQYTRWTGKGQDGKGVQLERAFLASDAHGNQWWKVKWIDEEEKAVVFEGLLNPKENRFVRMRAKFPDDAEGKELAVDEQTYYTPPQKLTKESIEGATKGVETVKVPAGTFKAKHVVFGGMDGTHEWWLQEKVPGGTVRQLLRSPKGDDDNHWDLQLTAYGNDAKSELGSK